MIVYRITKEYAPAFEEFIPKYVSNQIDTPGFFTIGEVVTDGKDHYGAGILQYYAGSLCEKKTARIVYIYVPEDERGESNAWSMLHDMERSLADQGIKKVRVYLGGEDREVLQGYMNTRGYEDMSDDTTIFKTSFSDWFSEKILALTPSKHVMSMSDVPKGELSAILGRFNKKELDSVGITHSGSMDINTKKLSFVYHHNDSVGIFISSVMPEGGIMVRMLKCVGDDPAKTTVKLLSYAGNRLKKVIPKDTPVYLYNMGDKAVDLIRKTSPDAKVYEVWRGEKKI